MADSEEISGKGLALALTPYVIWGFFPLYFLLTKPAGALEVIFHRTFWGLLACLVVVAALRQWKQVAQVASTWAILWRLMAAGLFVGVNWTVYVYAVTHDQVVDASLGYFVNPLFTSVLAVIVLRERLNAAQKIACALGVAAVLIMVVGLGRFPWIAVVLPLSFGMYSLVKKAVAQQVPAIAGIIVEAATLTPLLGAYFIYLWVNGRSSIQVVAAAGSGAYGIPLWGHIALLIGSGILTAFPLILLAAASKYLPLGILGMIQYINPIMQMIIGVAILGEHMAPMRWAATMVVWAAVLVMAYDMLRQTRRARKIQKMAQLEESEEGAAGVEGVAGVAGGEEDAEGAAGARAR